MIDEDTQPAELTRDLTLWAKSQSTPPTEKQIHAQSQVLAMKMVPLSAGTETRKTVERVMGELDAGYAFDALTGSKTPIEATAQGAVDWAKIRLGQKMSTRYPDVLQFIKDKYPNENWATKADKDRLWKKSGQNRAKAMQMAKDEGFINE